MQSSIGGHIRKRRLELGLLQKEVAAQIGVRESTICNWESNTTSPAIRLILHIIRFLGYSPFLSTSRSLPESLALYRKIHGLSQQGLAALRGVDESTLGNREARKPPPNREKPAPKDLVARSCFLTPRFVFE